MYVLDLTQFSLVYTGSSSCYSIIVVDFTGLVNHSTSEMGSVPINEPSYLVSQLILAITNSDLSRNFGLTNPSTVSSAVLQMNGYQGRGIVLVDLECLTYIELSAAPAWLIRYPIQPMLNLSCQSHLSLPSFKSGKGALNQGPFSHITDTTFPSITPLSSTALYRPERDGIAEHMNQTLTTHMTTNLIVSHIARKYWPCAVAHAAYTINCSPASAQQGMTPHKCLYD